MHPSKVFHQVVLLFFGPSGLRISRDGQRRRAAPVQCGLERHALLQRWFHHLGLHLCKETEDNREKDPLRDAREDGALDFKMTRRERLRQLRRDLRELETTLQLDDDGEELSEDAKGNRAPQRFD